MYAVLCTTIFTLKDALIRPPIPPNANSTIASTCAATEGSAHGSFVNQLSHPRPPRARPAVSSEAVAMKNPIRPGENTPKGRRALPRCHGRWLPGHAFLGGRPVRVVNERQRMDEVRAI